MLSSLLVFPNLEWYLKINYNFGQGKASWWFPTSGIFFQWLRVNWHCEVRTVFQGEGMSLGASGESPPVQLRWDGEHEISCAHHTEPEVKAALLRCPVSLLFCPEPTLGGQAPPPWSSVHLCQAPAHGKLYVRVKCYLEIECIKTKMFYHVCIQSVYKWKLFFSLEKPKRI